MNNEGRRRTPPGRADYALLAIVAVIGAWVVWQSQAMVRAEWRVLEARYKTTQWLEGKRQMTLPEWARARTAFTDAIAITPDNPSLYEYLGGLYVLRGRISWRSAELRPLYFGQARKALETSLRLRPEHALAWASLAYTLHALNEHGEPFRAAWHNARSFGPNKPDINRTLAEVLMASWAHASPEMRDWLFALYERSSPRRQKELTRLAGHYGLSEVFAATGARAQATAMVK